ncbi:hypothetical protein cce_5111 [Crocosphaera subtropica ATCC 51142]|uniref:Uncharacterized protein n=1 Tax=Crocosphaera subtropica (strain ATCC 51142 / BH68) TaxID=43989 RepID=B1X2U6_CROS5|nr:hypothetical protein [Crocosphaera subtropica]ACB54457.1 hypothetical protein cce_5111 [Crocosphaera subtropica ATCC 51142]
MNTKLLQPGQQIGVAKQGRIMKASIHTIDKVTPTGQVVIGDKRFNNRGQIMGSNPFQDQERLISLEEAQAIIAEKEKRALEKKKKRDQQKTIARTATQKAFEVLNQHGYYADVDGHWEVMESEINELLIDYMKKHKPIKD